MFMLISLSGLPSGSPNEVSFEPQSVGMHAPDESCHLAHDESVEPDSDSAVSPTQFPSHKIAH
jgi:hypothetical protein